jgi:hypothetical protein
MPRLDKYYADVVVDWVKHLIHSGKAFMISINATIGAAGTLILHITTPASTVSKGVEIDVLIGCNKTGTVVVTEGDTLTSAGTAKTAYAADRNSVVPISTTFNQDATFSAGTPILTEPANSGDSSRFTLILKPSTIYSITLTTDSATTIAIIRALVVEH